MRQEKGRSPGNKLVIPEGKPYGPQRVVCEVFGKRDSNGDPIRAFKCKCIHCGTTKTFLLNNLETGNTKSCKCLRGEPGNKLKISIEQVFGCVSVIEELEKKTFPSGQSQRQFKVRCKCGNEFSITLSNLRREPETCGRKGCRQAWNKGKKTGKPSWNKREIPVGQKVHELTVKSEAPKSNGRTMIECECSCGERVVIPLMKLGRTKSCGHLRNKPSVNREHMPSGKQVGPYIVVAESRRNGEWWVDTHCNRNVAHTMAVRNLRKKAKKNSNDCTICLGKDRSERYRRLRPIANKFNKYLWRAFEYVGLSKTGMETFESLGYTKEDAFKHLSPFLGKPCQMCKIIILNKANSQIDHIEPLCRAKTKADVIRLNQLINLRIVCKECNRKKGGKFNDSIFAQNNHSVMVDISKMIA